MSVRLVRMTWRPCVADWKPLAPPARGRWRRGAKAVEASSLSVSEPPARGRHGGRWGLPVNEIHARSASQDNTFQLQNMTQTPLRVVLAKVGLDGHDRGIQIVARGLRDAGFHVIYAGLWQTPEAVVRTVADEDADWLGLSLLSGAHLTLVPRVMQLLREQGLDTVGVMVGGIVPESDIAKLKEMGVTQVFGPGTPIADIVAFLRQHSESPHA